MLSFNKQIPPFIYAILIAMLLAVPSIAQSVDEVIPTNTTQEIQKNKLTAETLSTLLNFVELQEQYRKDLKTLRRELKLSATETDKEDVKIQLKTTEAKLKDTILNLENIAANTDLEILRVNQEEPFNLQKELFSLLEPAIKEMKHATSDVRLKSELREKIEYFQQREPIAKEALKNIASLNRANKNKKIKKALIKMNKNWSKQLVFIQSELQAKELQLTKLEAQEISFKDKSESFFKDFFQRRGWTLLQALFAIIGVLIISRLIHKIITHTVKGYSAEYRSVQFRVIDLLHRFFTFLFVIISPMIIFYFEEDWVLFSLGILFFLAMAWSIGRAIPRYWKQLELFLNIGPVREGERIMLDGIPWKVKYINMYSQLENPVAGLSQRVDIDDLVDLRSRPYESNEPWFPCKRGDWVHLKDGIRGKIIGVSIEFIQLVQRGGAVTTYQMADFLSLSPKNLSKSFRIKETFGISYSHQQQSTNEIVQILQDSIIQKATDEDYKEAIQSIRVEFESAADSSLNLVVIADFKGDVADIYTRLRRAIQRWCVDTCTENGWDIPYPQLTLHAEKLFSD
ncbi:MAG: hypothetical protein V3U71_07035 [Cocleimonas sp.]